MSRWSIVALLLAAGCAAREHSWSETSLCTLERPAENAPIAPDTWLGLLLRGWDPATRRATSPAVDCTGAQVRWDAPAQLCSDAGAALQLVADRPIGPDDVVVSQLGERLRLVWVVTNRFANGDGLGPAAVVEVWPYRLVVRALGHLRMNAVRPRLRLEKIGTTELLVAEGETCASADPASCHRDVRIMPLVGERYVPTTVVDAGGACVSPALFHLGREELEPLSSGWRRRYRLDATVSFGLTSATLHEQVVVNDFDPRHPNTPPRPYRRAESDAELRFDGTRFTSGGASLWKRMLEAR